MRVALCSILILGAAILQLSFIPALPFGVSGLNLPLVLLLIIVLRERPLGLVLALLTGIFFESYSSRPFLITFFSFIVPLFMASIIWYFLYSLQEAKRAEVPYVKGILLLWGAVALSGAMLRMSSGASITGLLWATPFFIIVAWAFTFLYGTSNQKSFFYSRR